MKQLIKELAIQQRELKSQRKTGTLKTIQRDSVWSDCYDEETRGRITTSQKATQAVQDNKVRITAALNLYHELRGSSYRHNVRDEYWGYDRALKKLREEFATQLAD